MKLGIKYLSEYKGALAEPEKIQKYTGAIAGRRKRAYFSIPTAYYNSTKTPYNFIMYTI